MPIVPEASGKGLRMLECKRRTTCFSFAPSPSLSLRRGARLLDFGSSHWCGGTILASHSIGVAGRQDKVFRARAGTVSLGESPAGRQVGLSPVWCISYYCIFIHPLQHLDDFICAMTFDPCMGFD